MADVEAARLTSPEMVMRALNFLPDDESDGHGFLILIRRWPSVKDALRN
ncbi:hypothetical protein [Herbaspirillum huttiense]|uniref:Uncharacterized protein n=2 Tax=Herbaspirillum huttiense TaxID=863372 RepID=A0AAJ2LU42_9BURK|nr:hypothetical protein [Herbaspirillum huttiense]MDR9839627.1 hypothetical protein [Herbaspirillum huttiense]